MLLRPNERPVLWFTLLYLPAFTIYAVWNGNYEFVLYGGVVLLIGGWILTKQAVIQFPSTVLWCLSLWGLLHMAGGNLHVAGDVLYSLQLIPVVLRYDQFVHTFGFGTATLIGYHLLKPYLLPDIKRWWPLAILVILIGSGFGAVNEILEFIAVKAFPETNVGGYDNTLLDMVFNLLGGVLAVFWLTFKRQMDRPSS